MFNNFKEDVSLKTSSNVKQFFNAVNLWNNRPNLLNKKLMGIDIVCKFSIINNDLIDEILQSLFLFLKLDINLNTEVISEFLKTQYNGNVNFDDDNLPILVYVKRMIPKMKNNINKQIVEICVFDFNRNHATFCDNLCQIDKTSNENETEGYFGYNYRISYKTEPETNSSNITLSFIVNEQSQTDIFGKFNRSTGNWLKDILLPKIIKWSEEDDGKNAGFSEKRSLKLVDVNDYCTLYQKLKDKYGKTFVEIWPESTDPLKFVYEDVAIATYLLLLWQDKAQNFIDMGCGNGLLVHILTGEGHKGLGLDVRSRKIWELYPEGTAKLEVKTISPNSEDTCMFPEADWLIGNHSDELTPWIPVIAASSSYKCKFFLLPCCSYELNGQKYQRQNSSKSQYMDYLDHIGRLCDFCGFNFEIDKLRIPSTKRICIVSKKRKYEENKHEVNLKLIVDLVKRECSSDVGLINDSSKIGKEINFDKFTTRSNEIKVRNCTQLDKDFVRELISLISKTIILPNNDKRSVSKCSWNEGMPISLNDLAKRIPGEYLKKLKKECGGLQTLIKNHHYIFKVDKGMVSFRRPVNMKNHKINNNHRNNKRPISFKSKRCWFYENHPDSCPLSDDDCPYSHVISNEINILLG